MSSTVLVVDVGSGIREIVERHVDGTAWLVVQREEVDHAWNDAIAKPPDLVVLNADVAKGWNLCAQLKRRFPAVPVVLLSYKANKELFNNHQKLPTRADAYHHLPDELEGLNISLSYFSSHKSEVDEEEQPRKQRTGSRVSVPTGVVQKLEQTVREQARDLEGLKRQIEALEAERDAVSEKARRQMMELMAVAPGPDLSGEVTSHKRRVAELEAELETVRAAARDAADRAQSAQESMRNAAHAAEAAQSEMIALRSQSRAAGNTAEQISLLTAQLAQAEQRRIAAEAARTLAEERATTAERAWSGVNARAEELHLALQQRIQDVERVTKEKSDIETTLAMSRKLMKDYISEAARNAEAARVATERGKELEARLAESDGKLAAVQGELEFQRTLVESLEETQRQAVDKATALEARVAALDGELATVRAAGAASETRVHALDEDKAREAHERQALVAQVQSLTAELAAMRTASEERAAAFVAAASADKVAYDAAVAAEKAALEASAAAERAAHHEEATAAQARYDLLRAWSKQMQKRLADAELTRDAVLARLQSLVDDLRALPHGGDAPPSPLD